MTKKIIAIVVSILAITTIGCFVGLNWSSIKTMLSGAQIYTAEQMEESYNQGYADANTNEDTYLQQLDYYKNLVEDNELEIENLNNKIVDLTNTNLSNQSQIINLNNIIEDNESTIENLQLTINDNNDSISNLNTQISGLNNEIESLENDIEDLEIKLSQSNEDYQILQSELTTKTNQVISLQNQVNSLQTLVNQLNATNEMNLNTISTLNSQIKTLNSQISDLTYQINNNDSIVSNLNNKITQLQESISYYENYISNLENETQVVITFEFDGSVYNIQIINKGASVSVVNPISNEYVQFNYWMINNEQIDLSTYVFNSNAKVVANVTYSYDVKFYVDNTEYDNQIVQFGDKANVPTVPTKQGYTFLGWSLNKNEIVDVSTVVINENTNFYALFVQQFTVQFVYEDDVVSTQSINNGEYASSPAVESTTYKIFNGWKVNGTFVDVDTYKIVGATIFVADITYKYDVTFMVDNEEYDNQIVVSGQYATLPTNPIKDGYKFLGWSINNQDIVDISSYEIQSNVVIYAIFEKVIVMVNLDNNISYYNDLSSAIDFATSSVNYSSDCLIKLYDDVEYDIAKNTTLRYIELDLNGNNLTYNCSNLNIYYFTLIASNLFDSKKSGSFIINDDNSYIRLDINSAVNDINFIVTSYTNTSYSPIYISSNTTVTINNCSIKGNSTEKALITSVAPELNLNNTIISNYKGQGIYIDRQWTSKCTLNISDCEFTNCSDYPIYSTGYVSINIDNSVVENNSKGLYIKGYKSNYKANLKIENSELKNNESTSHGLTLFISDFVNAELSFSLIYNNSTKSSGVYGALYVSNSTANSSNVKLISCELYNNTAYDGSAIYCKNSSIVLDNCSIHDNIQTYSVVSSAVYLSSSTLTLKNETIFYNNHYSNSSSTTSGTYTDINGNSSMDVIIDNSFVGYCYCKNEFLDYREAN